MYQVCCLCVCCCVVCFFACLRLCVYVCVKLRLLKSGPNCEDLQRTLSNSHDFQALNTKFLSLVPFTGHRHEAGL